MTLSFIIPAYNESQWIGIAIDAINASVKALDMEYEIIVVNDDSQDDTEAVATQHGAKVVTVCKRQISATRNAGAKVAKGDVFIFVDADTQVTKQVIEGTLRALDNGNDTVIQSKKEDWKPSFAQRGPARPWPKDFPAITSQVELSELQTAGLAEGESLTDQHHSPLYDKAKAGDEESSIQLVEQIIQVDKIADLATKYPGSIVVPVIAEEAKGFNRLPLAYAYAIGDLTGLTVNDRIIQTNRANHTGAKLRQRFMRVPRFDGPVEKGKSYIIVDDVAASGSSLVALRHYIESKGGQVVLATTLAHATPRHGMDPLQLAISDQTVQKIKNMFAPANVDDILSDYGRAETIRHLSEGEGQAILTYRDVDTLRTGLATGRHDGFRAQNEGAVFAFKEQKEIASDNTGNTVIGGGANIQWDQSTSWFGNLGLAFWNCYSRLFKEAAGCFVFCTRQAFEQVGGFDEQYFIAEELYLSRALRKVGKFVILKEKVITSNRKLQTYSPWHHFAILFRLLLRYNKAIRKRDGLDLWYDGKRTDDKDDADTHRMN